MHRKPKKPGTVVARNPDRTRGRILAAAVVEFAAKGFAGARVDAIARRARTNKRMLYHYFEDKEGLFRAVLRWKIAERRAWAENLPNDPAERLPFWFQTACQDVGWARLLGWEALQSETQKVIDEKERHDLMEYWVKRLRQRQAKGELTDMFDARHLALAMQSLTMFPIAYPQLTRLTMGRPPTDPKFQKDYAAFLKQFAVVFRPAGKKKI